MTDSEKDFWPEPYRRCSECERLTPISELFLVGTSELCRECYEEEISDEEADAEDD